MSISCKNLTSKLLGRKIVRVKSGDGEEIEFEIQKVNVETFAGGNMSKIESFVGKTEKEVESMFLDEFKRKEISKVVSPVLLSGIVSPKIVDKSISECDQEKEVSLSALLVDLELVTNIYMEILHISIKK